MFWFTGTASVFLWGAVGGLVTQIVANVALILRRQFTGNHSMPVRFKTPVFWIGVAGSAFLGGVITWIQGEALEKLHTIALQIGFAWPALFGVIIARQENPTPGSAD